MPRPSPPDNPPHTSRDPVVTAVAPQASNPNVVAVRIGRRVVARLSGAEVHAFGIRAGTPWTAELRSAVERCAAVEKARRHALRLLGQRARSRAELRDRLARRQPDASIVNDVLDDLQAAGWIDDEAFARQYAEELCRASPASTRFLEEKLRRRGIDDEVLRAVAAEVASGEDPTRAAETLARSHRRRLAALAPAVRARRLAGLMARRGFDDETIETVLHRLGEWPEAVED